MGIHWGPVYRVIDINQASNIVGAGINVAQRVMDCGDVGHILLSESAAMMLLPTEKWAKVLLNLGEYEIKHGSKIRIFSINSNNVGNPARPSRFAR